MEIHKETFKAKCAANNLEVFPICLNRYAKDVRTGDQICIIHYPHPNGRLAISSSDCAVYDGEYKIIKLLYLHIWL